MGLFWGVAAWILGLAVAAGGWGWVVPLAVVGAAMVVAWDLWRHRLAVAWDGELARTLLHVLSMVVLAAASLVWLGRLVATGRFGF